MPVGVSEFGSIVLQIDGVEIAVWHEYSFQNHFLIPCDGFRFSLGDEMMFDGLFDLLRPGKRVQLLINGKLQATGYIDVVDFSGDRSSGNVVTIEGRDVFSPLVDSEIDPQKRYPDQTPLVKLLQDTFEPFGFDTFFVDNEANSSVAAGKFINRPKKKTKQLASYRLTQTKPHHNERYFDFISRITQREGLWCWPTVDGQGVIVGNPDFDQAPRYQIIRKNGGAANNILSGGIRYDSTDQPSYIVATGNIPPTEHEHTRTRLVADNPYTMFPDPVAQFIAPTTNVRDEQVAQFNPLAGNTQRSRPGEQAGEVLTFSSAAIREHQELFKWTEVIPAKPIQLPNTFASLVAKPKYLKDTESRTQDQLRRFALRQMSLYVRRAVVGRYVIMGHELDGQPVQIDTVVDVQDDRSNWHGPMWILSRTLRKSRSGGTTTEIETLPLNSLVF